MILAFVDVPLYRTRWLADGAAGKTYLSIADGWSDAATRKLVTRTFQDWGPEMIWMGGYFTFAVWGSLAFANFPEITATVRSSESR